ncbi:g6092 [Coccomyxa elongata]
MGSLGRPLQQLPPRSPQRAPIRPSADAHPQIAEICAEANAGEEEEEVFYVATEQILQARHLHTPDRIF